MGGDSSAQALTEGAIVADANDSAIVAAVMAVAENMNLFIRRYVPTASW
ncbi:hypothetical protein [Cryobacterium sp. TMB1-7]|nr:hypothetical protein [Cryobacterium sp. TMB1-7]